MTWLLVVLIFRPLPDGGIQPRVVVHRAFATEEACNKTGRNFRDVIEVPEGAKSFSICITRDWFNQSGWKVEETE